MRRIWFDRTFELGLPLEALPDLIERLRGTPARLEERVDAATPDALSTRLDNAWSIQENVGHLLDLEALWAGRLDDFLAGEAELRPADLENRKTHEALHHDRDIHDLLSDFRSERLAWVARLEALPDGQARLVARHPRLDQPMSIVDLCFFTAEHDDHHLARITEIQRILGPRS